MNLFTAADMLQADLFAPDSLGCLLGLSKPMGKNRRSFLSGVPALFLSDAGVQVAGLNYGELRSHCGVLSDKC